jgi:hypothetical protein
VKFFKPISHTHRNRENGKIVSRQIGKSVFIKVNLPPLNKESLFHVFNYAFQIDIAL